ncbi:MAG: hypothetical protein ACJAR8_001956 [Bacteroidia bacterium]|jgi:hypothetical protein
MFLKIGVQKYPFTTTIQTFTNKKLNSIFRPPIIRVFASTQHCAMPQIYNLLF